jgi:hypothetical protein
MKKNLKLDIEFMFNEIARVNRVTVADIQSRSRRAEVIAARRMVCFYLRSHSTMTLSSIGKLLNVDHATVLHHTKIHKQMVFKNKKGNFVNYKYAKNYQDVSKSLLKKIGVPNQSYNMTYRKKKNNDIRAVVLPSNYLDFIKVVSEDASYIVFQCIAPTFTDALMRMDTKEIFTDRQLVKIEVV